MNVIRIVCDTGHDGKVETRSKTERVNGRGCLQRR